MNKPQSDNLGQELERAAKSGQLLEAVYELTFSGNKSEQDVAKALADLHNHNRINVITEFKNLKKSKVAGHNFFLTRFTFIATLPLLNANVQEVMDCVLHLKEEAGQDTAAADVIAPFIQFCERSESRIAEALSLARSQPESFGDLIIPIIIAGASINHQRYFDEAILLSQSEDAETKRNAIFALGRIQHPPGADTSPAINCLKQALENSTDDKLLGCVVRAIPNHLGSESHTLLSEMLSDALNKGGDYALHSASEVLFFNKGIISPLLDTLVFYLKEVDPKNNQTLKNIDYGMSFLIEGNQSETILSLLENLLDKTSIESYESTAYKILERPALLNKLTTRWFLKGTYSCRQAIEDIINISRRDEINIEADPAEFDVKNTSHLFFLTRKAIGFLFLKPACAANFVLSLMRMTNDKSILEEISHHLYNPLLINYSATIKEHLTTSQRNNPPHVKKHVRKSISLIDAYLSTLHSIGEIPELYPSGSARAAYRQHFSMQMKQTFKEAQRRSIFSELFSTTVLLYGRKSIFYQRTADGQSHRMETPLHSAGTSIEIARCQQLDPFGLEYALRLLCVEELST